MAKNYYVISHNGFHGFHFAHVCPISVECEGTRGIISRRTARRLDRLVCGISDCRCGERLSECDDPYALDPVYWVHLGEHEGRYPQR